MHAIFATLKMLPLYLAKWRTMFGCIWHFANHEVKHIIIIIIINELHRDASLKENFRAAV